MKVNPSRLTIVSALAQALILYSKEPELSSQVPTLPYVPQNKGQFLPCLYLDVYVKF